MHLGRQDIWHKDFACVLRQGIIRYEFSTRLTRIWYLTLLFFHWELQNMQRQLLATAVTTDIEFDAIQVHDDTPVLSHSLGRGRAGSSPRATHLPEVRLSIKKSYSGDLRLDFGR